MRPPVPTSTSPLQFVSASRSPGVPLLSYAAPLRTAVSKVTAIVAWLILIIVLVMVVHETTALLIERRQQGAAVNAMDDVIRARVEWMLASGQNGPREIAESEADFRDRRETIDRLCERVGIALPGK